MSFGKFAAGVGGVYLGLTTLSIGSHWFNYQKVDSWKIPQNDKTKALDASTTISQERLAMEDAIQSMFALKVQPKHIELLDDNFYLEDCVGIIRGPKNLRTFAYAFAAILKNHEMRDPKIERYSNSFVLTFDQSFKLYGIPFSTLPTIIYCEMNDDNTKLTKCEDHWFGRPFFGGLGTGNMIRQFNGKVIYQWFLSTQLPKKQ